MRQGQKAKAVTVTEGKAVLTTYPERVTKKMKVFYNPQMRMSRDVSTLAVKVYRLLKRDLKEDLKKDQKKDQRGPLVVDLLAGTGVRGIRYALEAGARRIILNDLNPSATRVIKANLRANKVKAEVKSLDGNALLSTLKNQADVIDVDPFGSPIDFLDSAARAISDGGLLMLTATDTAPLSGTYPNTCLRRYGAVPMRNDMQHEIGLRILFGSLARELARYDKGMEPLLAMSYKHFFRIFAIAKRGKAAADRTIAKIGYAVHCNKCGWRAFGKKIAEKCANCGSISKTIWAGPLWIGKMFDTKFIAQMGYVAPKRGEVIGMLIDLHDESKVDAPIYDTHRLCRIYKCPDPPRISDLVGRLKERGYKASGTSFSPTAIRTDAPISVIASFFRRNVKRDKRKKRK